ncbi:hypothetical protein [Erysipelothrix anatis]|uniref:hypothetical protein n=1 Tax=Erysipelothrix anatis TaxID=2683713 RepID=UPI001407F842|nr:hypothetical protein [Erysipelothrix anatis]
MGKKEDVEQLFIKMVGCRYRSYDDMENWFRQNMEDTLSALVIIGCEGINSEIADGKANIDYSTDCTFGKNKFDMEDADFTIDYIMDNAGSMYVTFVRWN